MVTTIVKNTDSVEHEWGGRIYAASSQYAIEEVDRIRLLSDIAFLTDLNSAVAVINNGDIDLPSDQGLLYLQKQLIFIHEDMDLYPAVGPNAAAAVKVSDAIAGFSFSIGDEMFTQGRLDDIVGDSVEFEAHFCIDNTVADRWIAFQISLLTTTGGGDKIVTTPDIVATAGPFELPTTANEIFRVSGILPSTYFQNGEKYIYFGMKRIDVTSLSKTNPTNNPVLFRICKIYTRRLDE